jgi:hypothetical protein
MGFSIRRGVSIVLVCLATWLSGGAAAAPPSPSAPPAPTPTPTASVSPATLTATVQSVDAQTRTLEVMTGVGYSLRVVKLSWKEPPTVKAAATAAGMAQVKPGDLVRVEHAKSAEGDVVKTIEVLPRPGAPSAR